jgi:hypothetical protein
LVELVGAGFPGLLLNAELGSFPLLGEEGKAATSSLTLGNTPFPPALKHQNKSLSI